MSRFVEGEDRRQPALLPSCLEDYIGEDNPARVVEVFVDELDLGGLGFAMTPAATGRPPWAWLGGARGATYVMVALLATPRLGAAAAIVAMIGGQMAASLALDHFGVLHERRPIDWTAVAGALLVGAGAFLILRRA